MQPLSQMGSSCLGEMCGWGRLERSLASPQPGVSDPLLAAGMTGTIVVLLNSQSASLFKESLKNEVLVGSNTAGRPEKKGPLAGTDS